MGKQCYGGVVGKSMKAGELAVSVKICLPSYDMADTAVGVV